MTEHLDRALQRTLLSELAAIYPHRADIDSSWLDHDKGKLHANLHYLTEHRLIDMTWKPMMDASLRAGNPCITASGLDFLQDDGGLSAILGTITVKLHDDTIRALLIDKIQKSDAAPGVKSRLIETIKGLPAEALKRLAQEAMDAGIEQLPEAAELLQGWLAL